MITLPKSVNSTFAAAELSRMQNDARHSAGSGSLRIAKLLAVALVLAAAIIATAPNSWLIVPCSLALLAYATGVLVVQYRRGELCSPIALYAALAIAHFALPGLLIPVSTAGFSNLANAAYAGRAELFVLLSFTAFHVGALIASPAGIPHGEKRLCAQIPWSPSRLLLLVVALEISGWLVRAHIFDAGAYFQADRAIVGRLSESLHATIRFVEVFPRIAVLLLAVWHWGPTIGNRPLMRRALAILWALEFCYWLPTGRKEDIILTLILPLMIRYMWTRRLVSIRWAAVIVLGILALFPATHYYRVAVDVWGDDGGALDVNVLDSLEAAGDADLYGQLRPFEVLLGRISLVEPVAATVRMIERGTWPLELGGTYAGFVFGLVPRIFWPSKPVFEFDAGVTFGHAAGISDPNDYATSISVTLFGEAFLNFGFVGSLVFFMYGLFFGFFYRQTWKWDSSGWIFQYSLLIPILLYVGGTFSAYFLGLLKTLIFGAMLLFVLNTPASGGRANSSSGVR